MITTPIAGLPVNSQGDRQLETHQMDDNFAALETALSTGFSALFASGGTSIPGLVTLTGTALRIQGRTGLTLDGVAAVSIVDQTLPLGALAAGKALVVISADPVTVSRPYTDVVTGQTLTDVMRVRLGQLVVIGAGDAGVTLDAQGYPLPVVTTLPVARLTRTADGATLDGTVDTPPTLRALSGGGVSTADLNALSTALTALLTAGLNDLDARLDVLEARPTIDVEAVQDTVAAMLGTQGTYDDVAGTYTLPPGLSSEQVMDTVAAMIQQGQNITVSYNDAADQFTISATGGGGVTSVAGRMGAVTLTSADLPDFMEAAQDAAGALLQDSADLDVTYDDTLNKVTARVTGLLGIPLPTLASGVAGQTIVLNSTKTAWIWATPTITAVAYSKYRLRITGNRGSTGVALIEMVLRSTTGGAQIATGGTEFCSPAAFGAEYSAGRAFDGQTNWQTAYQWFVNSVPSAGSPVILGYNLPSGQVLKEYTLYTTGSDSEVPQSWTMEGSNDGTNWTVLHTVTASNTGSPTLSAGGSATYVI